MAEDDPQDIRHLCYGPVNYVDEKPAKFGFSDGSKMEIGQEFANKYDVVRLFQAVAMTCQPRFEYRVIKSTRYLVVVKCKGAGEGRVNVVYSTLKKFRACMQPGHINQLRSHSTSCATTITLRKRGRLLLAKPFIQCQLVPTNGRKT